MNIVAATQQFAIHGPSMLYSSRLEQTSHSSISLPSMPVLAKKTTTTNLPDLRQTLPTRAMAEQKFNAVATTESTLSAVQNEDKQSSQEIPSVNAVERILDQLSTGKLLSWIDGNSLEKIQAQLTGQQRANTSVVKDLPAFSAQSMATSFGLDNKEALLERIGRSGIFSTEPGPQTPIAAASTTLHVDMNI